MKHSETEYIELFKGTGRYATGTVFTYEGGSRWTITCGNCKETHNNRATGNLLKGRLSCSCSKKTKYTAKLIEERLKQILPRGISFLSCKGTRYGEVNLICDEHGPYTLKNAGTAISGNIGCPGCRKPSSLKRSFESHVVEIMEKGSLPEGTVFSPSLRGWKYIDVVCGKCKDGEVYTVLRDNLKKGQKLRCLCHGKKFRSLEQAREDINKKLSRGIGWSLKLLSGSTMNSRVTASCEKHGEWETSVRDIIHMGTGCPSCANLDHDIFYINGVYDGGVLVGLKYGLTKSNSQTNRLYYQNRKSIFKISRLVNFSFTEAKACRDLESYLKRILKPIFTKSEVADGYTETCSSSHLDEIINLAIDYGGEREVDSGR